MPGIIDARDLAIRYGDFTAVDSVSISVEKGEIFGFLGPNGAGKTSTVRVLTTMRRPTSGSVSIGGVPVSEDPRRVRELIGVVQQNIALDPDISIRENIICKARLHKIPRERAIRRMEEICDAVGLSPYLDRIPRSLSGGWKRKAAIVCALIHDPEILFLDEPTAGLDTQSRHMLWDIIRLMNARGTTIFLTTHYMDEAESLCDHVAIISRGRITERGTPAELRSSLGRFCVEFTGDSGRRECRFFDTSAEARAFFGTVEDRGAVVRGTHLEDVFLQETGYSDGKDMKAVFG